jgi:F0F1-type ATP synthase assembly protein I
VSTPTRPPEEPDGANPHAEDEDPRLRIPAILRAPPPGKKDPPRPANALAQFGRAWGMALEFIATIILFAFGGWWLDNWKGWSPTCTLIGLAAGFVVAFTRIVQHTMRDQAKADAAKRQTGGDKPR